MGVALNFRLFLSCLISSSWLSCKISRTNIKLEAKKKKQLMKVNIFQAPLILLASWFFLLLSPESSLLALKRTGQEKVEVISVMHLG
jgi:hypothetical protein